MNINQTKLPENMTKNKNIILIIIIILMIFAILYYVLVLNDKSGEVAVKSSGKTLPNIEAEKKLLKSYKFIRLDSFIKDPIRVENSDKGRQNPFVKVE